MAYASKTEVSTEKSKAEIEAMVMKRGGDDYIAGVSGREAFVAFMLSDRRVLFKLQLPDKSEKRFTHTEHHRKPRTSDNAHASWDQACRSKWRALLLVIKAKLESIDAGIETFDEAFMPHIMTPDGRRFAEHAVPQIETSYRENTVPAPLRLTGPTSQPEGE